MKQRTKRPKSASLKPKSNLLFIIRIQGKDDMHPRTRKVLYNLKLSRNFHGVFMKASPGVFEMLQKVVPYVTFGYPNLKNVNELIRKKGYGVLNKQAVPLIDNNIIEQLFIFSFQVSTKPIKPLPSVMLIQLHWWLLLASAGFGAVWHSMFGRSHTRSCYCRYTFLRDHEFYRFSQLYYN